MAFVHRFIQLRSYFRDAHNIAKLQSWPKMSGMSGLLYFQNSTRSSPPPPPPMQCCHVAVFMYSPNYLSGYQHCLWEGRRGLPSLIATGYRYPKHKCTLQMLFSYLSRKILLRIVASRHFFFFSQRNF